jgi:hypothetical protein
MKLWYCSAWHFPQASQEVSVCGRVSGPGASAWRARPEWQATQFTRACFPLAWSDSIGSWQA